MTAAVARVALLAAVMLVTPGACSDPTTAPARPTRYAPPLVRAAYTSATATGPVTSQADPTKCLDIVGMGTTDGSLLQTWACSGNANQTWTIVNVQADGSFQLRAYADKCVDDPSGSSVDGTQQQIWTCITNPLSVNLPNQLWSLTAAWELKNKKTGKCLDLPTSPPANGTHVNISTCTGGTDQKWNAPTPPAVALGCSSYAPTGTGIYRDVSNAAGLTTALAAAGPGDVIRMADGTYANKFTAAAAHSGTAANRVVLCGSRNAIIDGGLTSSGIALALNADYWTLDGFQVKGAQKGISTNDADNDVIRGVWVHDMGQEAIHLQFNSSHNSVVDDSVSNTGRANSAFAEAVYIGTSSTQWVGGVPDRSDTNTVTGGYFGPGVLGDPIDIKEGTTGGTVRDVFVDASDRDGTQSPSGSNAPACIQLKGNNYRIVGMDCVGTQRNGVWALQVAAGWGTNNVVDSTSVDLSATTLTPVAGFRIDVTPNTVYCSPRNTATGGTFISGTTCTP